VLLCSAPQRLIITGFSLELSLSIDFIYSIPRMLLGFFNISAILSIYSRLKPEASRLFKTALLLAEG